MRCPALLFLHSRMYDDMSTMVYMKEDKLEKLTRMKLFPRQSK